ncbi:hypothetical protein IWZ03DRAFT_386609 [Phyllosticta citriasiana]|uniref:Uncharacterized protein n=1 Tax=Phyllosticta citriasiana TaxID=595635 RepID=A0ABR1KB71_9PEZI
MCNGFALSFPLLAPHAPAADPPFSLACPLAVAVPESCLLNSPLRSQLLWDSLSDIAHRVRMEQERFSLSRLRREATRGVSRCTHPPPPRCSRPPVATAITAPPPSSTPHTHASSAPCRERLPTHLSIFLPARLRLSLTTRPSFVAVVSCRSSGAGWLLFHVACLVSPRPASIYPLHHLGQFEI